MASFNRCPECSFYIGMYTKFIDAARQSLYEDTIFAKSSEYAKYDPEKMTFNPNIAPPLEPIFDALKIKNRCCRMHLFARTEFDKMYK